MTRKKEEKVESSYEVPRRPELRPVLSVLTARGRSDVAGTVGQALEDGTEKVVVHRFRDEYSLVGAPVLVRPLEEMVEALLRSRFMDDFFRDKIREALRGGWEFGYLSQTLGTPKQLYRMCTNEDLRKLAASGQLAQAVTKPGDMDARTGEREKAPRASKSCYRVAKPGKGDAELAKGLRGGGRQILGFMRAYVGPEGGEVTAVELRMLLEGKKASGELKTKMDVMKLFAFYMSQTFRKTEPPLVEYVKAEEKEDGDDDES